MAASPLRFFFNFWLIFYTFHIIADRSQRHPFYTSFVVSILTSYFHVIHMSIETYWYPRWRVAMRHLMVTKWSLNYFQLHNLFIAQRSDPSPIFNGWGPSGRGVSYTFGKDIVKVFLVLKLLNILWDDLIGFLNRNFLPFII